MSLFATSMSATTLLGMPKEVYTAGTQYFFTVLPFPLVGVVAIQFVRVLYPLGLSTSYEYLTLRFGGVISGIASYTFMFQTVLYISLSVYGPAIAMETVTGINWKLTACITFAVCTFYTSIGGLKAVIWTDVFQCVMLIFITIVVTIKGSSDVGGASKVFASVYESGYLELFNFDFDPRQRLSVWTTLIGSFFLWSNLMSVNHTSVQRYLSCDSLATAEKAIRYNVPVAVIMTGFCCYVGTVIFAYYYSRDCDPIKFGAQHGVARPDQIMPLFVMQVMGDIPAIPGLFMGALFAASLSTASSGLNALVAVFMKIVVKNKFEKRPVVETLVAMSISVGLGALAFGLMFGVNQAPGLAVAAFLIIAAFGGPVFGAFIMGIYVPWVNSISVLVGMIASYVLALWMVFGKLAAIKAGVYMSSYPQGIFTPKDPWGTEGCPASWGEPKPAPPRGEGTTFPLNDVSFMWLPVYTTMLVVFVSLIWSFCFPADGTKVDKRLIAKNVPHMVACLFPKITGIPQKVEMQWDQIGSNFQKATEELSDDSDEVEQVEDGFVKPRATEEVTLF